MNKFEYNIVLLNEDGDLSDDGKFTGIDIEGVIAKIDDVYFGTEDNLIVNYHMVNNGNYPDDLEVFETRLTLIIAQLLAEMDEEKNVIVSND